MNQTQQQSQTAPAAEKPKYDNRHLRTHEDEHARELWRVLNGLDANPKTMARMREWYREVTAR
jgi:hypothetical protein